MKSPLRIVVALISLGGVIGCASPEPAPEGGSSSTAPSDETYTTAGGESLDEGAGDDEFSPQ